MFNLDADDVINIILFFAGPIGWIILYLDGRI